MRIGDVYHPISICLALPLCEFSAIWVIATGWDARNGVHANKMVEKTIDATARIGNVMKEECKTC